MQENSCTTKPMSKATYFPKVRTSKKKNFVGWGRRGGEGTVREGEEKEIQTSLVKTSCQFFVGKAH